MKSATSCWILTVALLAISCQPKTDQMSLTVKQYHTPPNSGLREGGVKLIPIHTPSGDFKVWTKTIGHNPRIKVLLLHGGPAGTHEYWECAESFSRRRVYNLYCTINWDPIILINLRIAPSGP